VLNLGPGPKYFPNSPEILRKSQWTKHNPSLLHLFEYALPLKHCGTERKKKKKKKEKGCFLGRRSPQGRREEVEEGYRRKW
jgi:hypothetical protein